MLAVVFSLVVVDVQGLDSLFSREQRQTGVYDSVVRVATMVTALDHSDPNLAWFAMGWDRMVWRGKGNRGRKALLRFVFFCFRGQLGSWVLMARGT